MARQTAEMVERTFATYSLDDEEWAALVALDPFPPRTGRKVTDWRSACAGWLTRYAAFGGNGAHWKNIPNGSAWRMAMVRAREFGTFNVIERHLPRLPLRQEAWWLVIAGARRYGR